MNPISWIPEASKKIVLMLALAAGVLAQVTLYETAFLPESQHALFLLLKLAPSFFLLVLLPLAFRNPTSKLLKILVAMIFIYYPLIGSLYRPWYVLATLQLVLIYGFFMDAKPKLYWSYAAATFLAFYIPFWIRWPDVPENYAHLGRGDWIGIGAQELLILSMTYVFVFRARKFERQTEANFIAIGKHAARVTHDLKGMLSAPLLYLDYAKAVLSADANASPALISAVSRTQRELGDLHLAVGELSRLTSTTALPVTEFEFGECIRSTALLFQRELALYDYTVAIPEPSARAKADRSLVTTLIFELYSVILSLPPAPTGSRRLVVQFDPQTSCAIFRRDIAFDQSFDADLFAACTSAADELRTPLKFKHERSDFRITWDITSLIS